MCKRTMERADIIAVNSVIALALITIGVCAVVVIAKLIPISFLYRWFF